MHIDLRVNVSIALSREALNSTSLTATGPVTAISPADGNDNSCEISHNPEWHS